MRNSAIAASGLRKAYKDKIVLDGIDLDVEKGTVFSLLGPNGAGKTTTVNVLTTLIKADGGTALVAGHDVATETRAVRAAIGVTGQFAAVDELLTGQENLQLMADLKRLGSGEAKRVVTDLLERFDLTESARKLASIVRWGQWPLHPTSEGAIWGKGPFTPRRAWCVVTAVPVRHVRCGRPGNPAGRGDAKCPRCQDLMSTTCGSWSAASWAERSPRPGPGGCPAPCGAW
jgi:hypothetical protein